MHDSQAEVTATNEIAISENASTKNHHNEGKQEENERKIEDCVEPKTPVGTPTPLTKSNQAKVIEVEVPSTTSASTSVNDDGRAAEQSTVVKPCLGPPANYTNRRTWVTTERMNELRRRAQEALKHNKTFTIRGCFNSVRNALALRGWVEKLDLHRKHIPTGVCQVSYDDLAQGLPKRKPGETRAQYISKCERNIMSRFLEHMPIDFLWTNRKEKCDYIDQAKNPGMTINKFHRAPFTSKEGLCAQLKDFHWFYEEGTAEMYFPRCYNVWSPEELTEFIENFKLTACVAFLRWITDKYGEHGYEAVFSPIGKVPLNAIDFAYKRCTEFIESCQHSDIDNEDPPKIWEHDWDAFLGQHQQLTCEGVKIFSEQHHRVVESVIRTSQQLLEDMQHYWPQYSLDGYSNLWIVKPANKCRGRGIQLMDNLKKILNVVNPSIASKSRYVVQKYIERPLIIHRTKFDIRQWFLVTNVQPMVIWMYKESYLRFSSQEYSLSNHHESVHLTNHAVQKRYTNGKRDKRLPNENMWDCYSFQAYLRQIGKHELWEERIYPGMRKAIVGTMLASQDSMDRRPNTFELFGADFMISEDFFPWLIEINSSPDLGATTSVTARMCPQCLEDVVKVVIDRRIDPKADVGNFELAYRQVVPPTPAYMGLNLLLKGKQLISKTNHSHHNYYYQRKERTLSQSHLFRQRTALIPAISNVHRVMPTFNATEYIEKCIAEATNSSVSSTSISTIKSTVNEHQAHMSPLHTLTSARRRIVALATASTIGRCPNLLRTPRSTVNLYMQRRRSFEGSTRILAEQPVHKQPKINDPQLNTEDFAMVPVKRFRSCGPRLNTKANVGENEQKIKVIIQKCNIQKNQSTAPDPTTIPNFNENFNLPSSKSEPNLAILLHKLKPNPIMEHQLRISPRNRLNNSISNSSTTTSTNLQLNLRGQFVNIDRKPSRQIQVDASASAPIESKISTSKPSKASKQTDTEKTPETDGSLGKTSSSHTDIHAVGKRLSSWQTARSLTNLSTKAAISAYAQKSSKSSDFISGTTNRVKSAISPKRMRKRTRSEIFCRNTRC